MAIKIGDKVKVLVDYMTPALIGDIATVVSLEGGEKWPIITTVDGKESTGHFYFTESEVEPLAPEVSQLDRIERKMDRLLLRFFGEVYQPDGTFVKR